METTGNHWALLSHHNLSSQDASGLHISQVFATTAEIITSRDRNGYSSIDTRIGSWPWFWVWLSELHFHSTLVLQLITSDSIKLPDQPLLSRFACMIPHATYHSLKKKQLKRINSQEHTLRSLLGVCATPGKSVDAGIRLTFPTFKCLPSTRSLASFLRNILYAFHTSLCF